MNNENKDEGDILITGLRVVIRMKERVMIRTTPTHLT